MNTDNFLNITSNRHMADANEYSPLALAYMGDAVFELLSRSWALSGGTAKVKNLHNLSGMYVNAGAQAGMYMRVFEILNEDERRVLKSGRNAKSLSKAKNASISDYRRATGLEALFGYLYLKGENSRILELFSICTECVNMPDELSVKEDTDE